MTRRAASIWRLVIQHSSIACSPNSPKARSLPWVATPLRRPRWTLRNLTRAGSSIASAFLLARSPSRGWLLGLTVGRGGGALGGGFRPRPLGRSRDRLGGGRRRARLGAGGTGGGRARRGPGPARALGLAFLGGHGGSGRRGRGGRLSD